MKKLGFLVLMVSFALLPTSFAFAHHGEDWNCSDIKGHPERAEHYYKYHMPDDPDDLDRDGDGVICDGTYQPPSKGGDDDKGSDDSKGSDDKGSNDSKDDQNNNSGSNDNQGGQLPKTATSHPTYSLLGGLMALLGAALLIVRRRVLN